LKTVTKSREFAKLSLTIATAKWPCSVFTLPC